VLAKKTLKSLVLAEKLCS